MMVGFIQIQKSLFLMLMLQFTAVSGQFSSFIVVRHGDDVTLPCDNVRDDQDKCDRTTWFFSVKGNTATVTLFEDGQIHQEAKSKSHKLNVTENCSLVIKKVTVEDVGRYTCRQTKPEQRYQDSFVHLSVVSTSTGSYYSSVTVRKGDDAILPCENVIDNNNKCHSTTFLFSSRNSGTVELITHGQINEKFKSKSHRLSVTENCSLVIKKVTDEDVGRYTCRQYKRSDSVVDVSVVTRTGHKDDDKVTLNCSVWTHGPCGHTVKWLYDHNKNEFTDTETPQSSCSVTVTLTTSDLNQKYSDLLKCEVTHDSSGEVQQFTFRRPSSGGTSGKKRKTTTTTTTSTMKERTSKVTINTFPTNKRNPTTKHDWPWWIIIIIVAVSLAALLIIVASIIRWKKSKGKKTQTDKNLTDPEDGVCYASVSYTKKAKAQDQGDDDEGDTVTYSCVKASSSFCEASTDTDALYAAINKTKK